jgi:hypothetical protein
LTSKEKGGTGASVDAVAYRANRPRYVRQKRTFAGHNRGMEHSADSGDVLGASESLITGRWEWPVHGLRHPPSQGTSGWYVWTGDLAASDDFFQPWHQAHLVERCPQVAHLLQLPPGSRFLVAPGHEDVWEDTTLLDV